MKLPEKAAPVTRDKMVEVTDTKDINASCCPGGKQCYGLCIFGLCTGVCA